MSDLEKLIRIAQRVEDYAAALAVALGNFHGTN